MSIKMHGDRKGRHYDTWKTGRKRQIVVATLAVAMSYGIIKEN